MIYHASMTVSCSWASLLKLWVQQALLSFHHSTKHAFPLYSTAKLAKMPIRVIALAFSLCILYYRSSYSWTTLITGKTSKEGDCRSISMECLWSWRILEWDAVAILALKYKKYFSQGTINIWLKEVPVKWIAFLKFGPDNCQFLFLGFALCLW